MSRRLLSCSEQYHHQPAAELVINWKARAVFINACRVISLPVSLKYGVRVPDQLHPLKSDYKRRRQLTSGRIGKVNQQEGDSYRKANITISLLAQILCNFVAE